MRAFHSSLLELICHLVCGSGYTARDGQREFAPHTVSLKESSELQVCSLRYYELCSLRYYELCRILCSINCVMATLYLHNHSLTLSHIHSLTRSHTHTLTHPLTHSLTHSLTHTLTHSLTHSLSHSLTHPLTHPLTHSCIITDRPSINNAEPEIESTLGTSVYSPSQSMRGRRDTINELNDLLTALDSTRTAVQAQLDAQVMTDIGRR